MLGLDDLFQSEEFLSMEFAPSSLKVARAQPDGSSLSVEYVDREPVDPDDPDRVEKYTRALSTLRDRRSFSGISEVAFSLPTSGVIVRPLELPAVSGDRLDRAVRYEVEDKDSEIPFSPQDVVMDYEVIERTDEVTRVVLAVVKRDKMEDYLTVVGNAGLEAKIIDVTSFSLFNFFHHFQQQTDDSSPQALVDVGEYHTDIIVFRGSSLHYARSTSVAGRQFTESVEDHLGVDFDRAEEIKIERGNLPLTEEPQPPGPPEPPSPEDSTAPDESDQPPAPPAPPGESGEEPGPKNDVEADEEPLSLGTEFETEEEDTSSSGVEDSEESPEPPSPPEPPTTEPESSEEASAPPPPPGESPEDGAETIDEGTDPEEDSPRTEFEAGEGNEESSDHSELDLGKSLEAGEDEAEDDSGSLTLGDDSTLEDEDDGDEEPTLDSSLDLEPSESESEPEAPNPPNDVEPSSGNTSDEGPAPPPPPDTSGTESPSGDDDDTEEPDVSLGTEYGDEDPSGELQPEESKQASPEEPSPRTDDSEDSPDSGEDELDLSLGLGERRSPDRDSDSGEELTDPLSEDEDKDEDENDENSLGAAANDPPAPPSDPDFDPEDLQDALEQPVQRLVDELRQTFDYFRDEMNGENVEEIVLCGNGARINNLPAYLEEELGRNTRYFQPGPLTGLADEQSIQTMTSVLGLQLRSEPSWCPVQLNLLPQELVRERERQERRQKMIVNGALAGLLVLQVLIWLFYSYQVRLSHYQTAQQQLEQVQPIVDRVSQLEETQGTLQQRLNVINDLETRRARLLPVLHALNQLESPLRERTWIQNISYSTGDPNGVLEIEGVTGSFQDVSSLYQWLQNREFTVEQTSGSQNRGNLTVDGEQRGVVEFSVGYEVRFDSFNTSNRES